MASEYHWLVTAGLITSSVIAVTANLLLLVVFARRRGLRTVPNRFVINLLVTNLLSSVLLIPLLLVDQSDYDENHRGGGTNRVFFLEEDEEDGEETAVISDSYGDNIELVETTIVGSFFNGTTTNGTNHFVLCYLAQSSTSLVCTASIFSILLIGVNQYFAVIHSLRYHFYVNKCRSVVLIGTSWFVSVMFSLMKAATQTDSSLWRFCHNQPKPTKFIYVFNAIYAFAYFIVVILVPFVAISIIYVCIYKAAHKNSERMRKSTSGSCNGNLDSYVQVPVTCVKEPFTGGTKRTLVKVHSAPNFLNLESSGVRTSPIKVTRTCSERTPNNFINSIKYKISNVSVFRYREETRAAKISIIVIFMVLICYIPYGTILILNSNVISVRTPKFLNYISLVLLVLSNIVSPFLFAYRNKRIQRELGKFFGLISKQNTNKMATPRRNTLTRRSSFCFKNENITEENCEGGTNTTTRPFLYENQIPQVIVTCKNETAEKKSILKRVCSTKNWSSYKKCTFITVPDSCLGADARGSFSSASTQISSED